MKPWEHLDTAATPDDGKLELWRHDRDYAIRAEGYDLMVSRAHHSEDVMMSLACPEPPSDASVLIGGLGMGYTLRATLDLLPTGGTAVVSELIPKVVEWNRGVLGPLAGNPLDDARTEVAQQDVVRVIRESESRFGKVSILFRLSSAVKKNSITVPSGQRGLPPRYAEFSAIRTRVR